MNRHEYQVVLRVERPHRDDPGGIVGLRRLLKALLRGYGFRAVSVLPTEPGAIPTDAGAVTSAEIDAALARRDFDAADVDDPDRGGGPLDGDVLPQDGDGGDA